MINGKTPQNETESTDFIGDLNPDILDSIKKPEITSVFDNPES